MAKIGLNIVVTGFSGKLLIRWLENSAPLAEVGRSDAFDFPYNDVYVINNLNPVAHIVQLWQSTDGVALTQLITEWQIDATLYNEISSITYQYKVGRGYTNLTPVNTGAEVWADPADTDTELVDERLDGATKEQLYVVEAGYGPKLDVDYDLRSGGGIILTGGGTFNQDTPWFITHNRIVTQNIDSSGPTSSDISDVQVITTDVDFYTSPTVNLYNKLGVANGSGNVLTVNFLAFALMPNGTRGMFNTHRGSQNYLKLQFGVGDTIYFNGTARNVIYLAKGEEIKLVWKDGAGYVVSYTGNDKIRGQVVGDWQDRSGISGAYLLANESVGILAGADFPGLLEWLESLPPGVTVTMAAWATDKTRWALESGNFRPPHLANMHRRFRDTTEAPGTFQDHGIGSHTHPASTDGTLLFIKRKPGGPGGGLGVNAVGGGYESAEANTGNNPGGIVETRVKNFKEIPLIVL